MRVTLCAKALFEFSKKIELGKYIFQKGEEITGGRERPSIISDALKQLSPNLSFDGGIEPVSKYILSFIPENITPDGVVLSMITRLFFRR